MIGMDGNPHAQPAINRRGQIIDAFSEGGSNTVPNTLALAQLEATLALAYEQRTMALATFYATIPSHAGDKSTLDLQKTIIARLGLNETKED